MSGEKKTNVDPQTARNMLRSIVERVGRVDEEIKACNEDKRDIYAEAKANGFETKIVKAIIRDRRIDPAELAENQAVYDLYKAALEDTAPPEEKVNEKPKKEEPQAEPKSEKPKKEEPKKKAPEKKAPAKKEPEAKPEKKLKKDAPAKKAEPKKLKKDDPDPHPSKADDGQPEPSSPAPEEGSDSHPPQKGVKASAKTEEVRASSSGQEASEVEADTGKSHGEHETGEGAMEKPTQPSPDPVKTEWDVPDIDDLDIPPFLRRG